MHSSANCWWCFLKFLNASRANIYSYVKLLNVHKKIGNTPYQIRVNVFNFIKSHSFKTSEDKKKMQMRNPLTDKRNVYTIKDEHFIYFTYSLFKVYTVTGLLPECCGIKVPSEIFVCGWFAFSFWFLYWSQISHLSTFYLQRKRSLNLM